jgi:hypothetical protein
MANASKTARNLALTKRELRREFLSHLEGLESSLKRVPTHGECRDHLRLLCESMDGSGRFTDLSLVEEAQEAADVTAFFLYDL